MAMVREYDRCPKCSAEHGKPGKDQWGPVIEWAAATYITYPSDQLGKRRSRRSVRPTLGKALSALGLGGFIGGNEYQHVVGQPENQSLTGRGVSYILHDHRRVVVAVACHADDSGGRFRRLLRLLARGLFRSPSA